MNNLQHIIKDDTKAAMHMAVELCEQGDFDSVTEAFRWLMQERDDATAQVQAEDYAKRCMLLEALAKDLYENAIDFAFKGWVPYYKAQFAALGIEMVNE